MLLQQSCWCIFPVGGDLHGALLPCCCHASHALSRSAAPTPQTREQLSDEELEAMLKELATYREFE